MNAEIDDSLSPAEYGSIPVTAPDFRAIALLAVEALEWIKDLDPYPSTEVNIRRSHKRHREIAERTLTAIAAEIEKLEEAP